MGNLKGRDQSEDLDVDGKIILERTLGNRVGLNASGSGQGLVSSFEHGHEPSDSTKAGNFLTR